MNFLSVLSYAVNTLQVPHIIICGHYNCGGVRAALSPMSLGLIDNWVMNIRDTYQLYKIELEQAANETEKINKLVEYNVMKQVKNLVHTSIIQKSWHDKHAPRIHGWVYDLNSGLIKELVSIKPGIIMDSSHRYDF